MIVAILVFVFVLSLTSCYKSETTTFTDTTYVLKEQVSFDKVLNLNDVKLKLTEITKDEYDASNKINAITSRYDDKCYKIELSLNIGGVEYNNVATHEIPGSSAYNNRYKLAFDLQIDGKTYPCIFRMDLYHYQRESESIEEDKATSIHVYLLEAIDKGGTTNGNDFATFWLINQGNSKQ